MSLRFSKAPGCWERHLQRQYNNPLFTQIAQPLTQEAVNHARQQDEQERQQFQQAFQALLTDVASLASQVEAAIIFKMQDRIDVLYEQCAALGGDFSDAKRGLRELNNIIMQVIKSSAEITDASKAETLDALISKDQARQLHFNLLEYPLIAHLLHPSSPIKPEELVPTLLSEDEASLRAAMSLLDLEKQKILCDEARALLTYLKLKGNLLDNAWERLAMMEQPLYRPN